MADAYRVLVTGSRAWTDYETVRAEIGKAVIERCDATGTPFPSIVVVHGAARGADALAARAAAEFGLPAEAHPADWRPGGKFDRSAGYRRNAEMIALGANLVLAFIKDNSSGATHCADLAERSGIETRRFAA